MRSSFLRVDNQGKKGEDDYVIITGHASRNSSTTAVTRLVLLNLTTSFSAARYGACRIVKQQTHGLKALGKKLDAVLECSLRANGPTQAYISIWGIQVQAQAAPGSTV